VVLDALRHLVTSIEELDAAGVSFVSMGETIDTTSPTGRLLLGVLGSLADYADSAIMWIPRMDLEEIAHGRTDSDG